MNHAIILAAGLGRRMKIKKDKLLLPVCGHPVVYYSIMAFNDHPEIDSITVVANKNNIKEIKAIIKTYHFTKVKNVVLGGEKRIDSLEKGLSATSKFSTSDIILVHNGANPLPSFEEISKTILQTQETGACIVGHFISSTIKEINDKHIIKTHDRKKLFAAETPQAATYQILKKALNNAKKQHLDVTDEAMMFEAIDQKVAYVEAHENNFKITTHADHDRLRAVLGDMPENFRVGIGQDSHVFEENKKGLTLAGVFLPNELKLEANSDGDVILHAVFNALSQSIGEMSLGFYADKECEKGVKDSKKYVEIILKKIHKQKFKLNSLGIMIEAGKPKIDPLVPQMKKNLSNLLGLDSRRIGITATSGENTTVFGEGLGIQCFAIVSLVA